MEKDSIKKFIKFRKPEVIIALVAIAIRCVVWFLVTLRQGSLATIFLDGDAREYWNGMINLLSYGRFSIILDSPDVLDAWRTPGFSAVAAAMRLLTGGDYGVIVLQIALAAATAILTYHCAKLFLSQKASLTAGILTALEPNFAFWSLMFMSDTVFVFLLVAAVYFFGRGLRSEKPLVWLMVSSGLLGLSAYVRELGLYLIFFFAVFVSLFYWKQWRVAISRGLIFFVIGFLLVIPWIGRNLYYFNMPQMSWISSYNMLAYNGAAVLAAERGTSISEQRNQLFAEALAQGSSDIIRDPSYRTYFFDTGFSIIRENISIYSKLHAASLFPFFLNPGFTFFDRISSDGALERHCSISQLMSKGQLGSAISCLAPQSPVQAVFQAMSLLWVIVYVMLLRLFIAVCRKKIRVQPEMALYVLLIAYFAVTISVAAGARYRLPAEPFIFILMSAGLYLHKNHDAAQ